MKKDTFIVGNTNMAFLRNHTLRIQRTCMLSIVSGAGVGVGAGDRINLVISALLGNNLFFILLASAPVKHMNCFV